MGNATPDNQRPRETIQRLMLAWIWVWPELASNWFPHVGTTWCCCKTSLILDEIKHWCRIWLEVKAETSVQREEASMLIAVHQGSAGLCRVLMVLQGSAGLHRVVEGSTLLYRVLRVLNGFRGPAEFYRVLQGSDGFLSGSTGSTGSTGFHRASCFIMMCNSLPLARKGPFHFWKRLLTGMRSDCSEESHRMRLPRLVDFERTVEMKIDHGKSRSTFYRP